MNNIIYILFLLSLISFGQKKSIQNEFEIITEEIGDLDNDGIDEKVVIYETNDEKPRRLWIFKNDKGKWIEWIKTRSAVRKSTEGGPMGDPFEGIEIKNNILSIYFNGGSNWKWAYTDNYKFQNNQFQLITYSHLNFKTCDTWDSLDFNLVTGKIILKDGYENCLEENKKEHIKNTETFYKKDVTITLQNRNTREVKIKSPKGKIVYLY